MSRSSGNVIGDSLQLSLGYAERLLVGIPGDKFARFATNQAGPVESNHAAFVYGHLSLYPGRILKEMGLPSTALPTRFQDVFSKDAKCVDDATGQIYPAPEAITSFFFDGYRAALKAFRVVSDDTLQQPNTMGGPMTEKFPTLGSLYTFYTGGHMMMHLGQLSAWRRMIGLSAA